MAVKVRDSFGQETPWRPVLRSSAPTMFRATTAKLSGIEVTRDSEIALAFDERENVSWVPVFRDEGHLAALELTLFFDKERIVDYRVNEATYAENSDSIHISYRWRRAPGATHLQAARTSSYALALPWCCFYWLSAIRFSKEKFLTRTTRAFIMNPLM